jgi:hypothetical protein
MHDSNGMMVLPNWHAAKCSHCRQISVWFDGQMVFPLIATAPLPNNDLPDEIIADYNEARQIVSSSPRGAAALLRLAIQKLCAYLGEKAEINTAIATLVKKGLSPIIQQALDIVRVIGNNAVHPGQIDLKDDQETAIKLFDLVNLIAEAMITQPKHVQAMYVSLPESSRNAIEKRDKA